MRKIKLQYQKDTNDFRRHLGNGEAQEDHNKLDKAEESGDAAARHSPVLASAVRRLAVVDIVVRRNRHLDNGGDKNQNGAAGGNMAVKLFLELPQ